MSSKSNTSVCGDVYIVVAIEWRNPTQELMNINVATKWQLYIKFQHNMTNIWAFGNVNNQQFPTISKFFYLREIHSFFHSSFRCDFTPSSLVFINSFIITIIINISRQSLTHCELLPLRHPRNRFLQERQNEWFGDISFNSWCCLHHYHQDQVFEWSEHLNFQFVCKLIYYQSRILIFNLVQIICKCSFQHAFITGSYSIILHGKFFFSQNDQKKNYFTRFTSHSGETIFRFSLLGRKKFPSAVKNCARVYQNFPFRRNNIVMSFWEIESFPL